MKTVYEITADLQRYLDSIRDQHGFTSAIAWVDDSYNRSPGRPIVRLRIRDSEGRLFTMAMEDPPHEMIFTLAIQGMVLYPKTSTKD